MYSFDAVGNTALCWLKAPGLTAISKILSVDESGKVTKYDVATLSGWVNISLRSLQPK